VQIHLRASYEHLVCVLTFHVTCCSFPHRHRLLIYSPLSPSTASLPLILSISNSIASSKPHAQVPYQRFSDCPPPSLQQTTRVAPCHLISLLSLNPTFLIFSFLSFNQSFRFPFLPCPMVQAKHRQHFELTPAVAPLNTPFITPQTEYQMFPWITSLCRIVAGDAHSLLSILLYSQPFHSILVLSQHCQHINTHRLPC